MPEVDFPRLRRQAGSLTQRDLIAVGRRLGWEVDTRHGKGSHVVLKNGGARTTVPQQPKRGTALAILKALERQAEA